jgi:hypothetical protein
MTMRSGRPRVSSVGGPYDNAEPSLSEVIARLQQGQAPGELAPTDLQPGVMNLPRRLVDRISGFLDRIEEDHFSGRRATIPHAPKDPTASEYGTATRENTITWGATADASFDNSGAVEVTFPRVSTQLLHVNRPRATQGIVLTVVSLGTGWNGENQTTFTLSYTVGVGQGQITIPKQFVLTVGDLVAANNTVPIVDVNSWPIQALQVAVAYNLSPANLAPHGVVVASFFAPVVQ